MKARYNYRIYPKQSQLIPIAKAMGCSRVVWNDAWWLYKNAERNKLDRPTKVSSLVITQAKKTEERKWLSEVSSVVLQQSLRDLEQAWSNYFDSKTGKRKGKEVGKPKPKKKHGKQAIRFASNAFSVHSQSVYLAKIGHVKVVFSRSLPSKPTSVTIIKDSSGRYFASFVVEIIPETLPKTNSSIGIDLGLTYFAILSTGEKIENPRLHKKTLRKIKKANRRLAKAKKDSNRRKKRKLRLAKLHAKVKDRRTDFLHKLTTRLVRENQALAVENLNVAGMVKNRKLSRAISDAGWAKFKTILEAKCDKYGRHLTIVDRWFASSQICSCCGKSGGKKELDVREWECLFCNTIHDRDINASINLNQWAGGQSDQYGVHKCLGKTGRTSPGGNLQGQPLPQATTPHKNERGASVSPTKLAVCNETLTTPRQLTLF